MSTDKSTILLAYGLNEHSGMGHKKRIDMINLFFRSKGYRTILINVEDINSMKYTLNILNVTNSVVVIYDYVINRLELFENLQAKVKILISPLIDNLKGFTHQVHTNPNAAKSQNIVHDICANNHIISPKLNSVKSAWQSLSVSDEILVFFSGSRMHSRESYAMNNAAFRLVDTRLKLINVLTVSSKKLIGNKSTMRFFWNAKKRPLGCIIGDGISVYEAIFLGLKPLVVTSEQRRNKLRLLEDKKLVNVYCGREYASFRSKLQDSIDASHNIKPQIQPLLMEKLYGICRTTTP